MEVVSIKNYSYKDANTKCKICSIHIKINNIKNHAMEVIDIIKDESWVLSLDSINKVSYKARAKRTINKLVENIITALESDTTEQFGEYIVSVSSQNFLVQKMKHLRVPLAELIKEKVLGNPGFDFHTETKENLIAFGEAKYSSNNNPHGDALSQICKFIDLQKDIAEFTLLRDFVSNLAIENALKNKKSYVAAFSVNSDKPEAIMKNALNSKYIKPLFLYTQLYLIGVEIDVS